METINLNGTHNHISNTVFDNKKKENIFIRKKTWGKQQVNEKVNEKTNEKGNEKGNENANEKIIGNENANEKANEKVNEKVIEKVIGNTVSFKNYLDKGETNFQTEEKLPDRIEGFYINDYNILYIHDILLKKFDQDNKNNIKLIEDQIKILEEKITGNQNLIERKTSRKKIEIFKNSIDKYINNKKEYIEKSKDLISAYRQLGPIKKISCFFNREIKTNITDENQELRYQIIEDYLEIARKYICIDLVRQIPEIQNCPNCDFKHSENLIIDEFSGNTFCLNCGLEKISIVKNPAYSDGSRINNSRNNYDDKANFRKALLRLQGKQDNKPSKELYEQLDKYFISRNLPCSKDYQKFPLKADGTKEGTNKEMIFEALSRIGCSGYYDDIDLICSVFFGWNLLDVSHLEELILQDYDESQRVHEELDKEGRKSSLNSQFRLYCHLKHRGVKVKMSQFKIPITPSILEYHKIRWNEICSILNWKKIF